MKSIAYAAIMALLIGAHHSATADALSISCRWSAPTVRANGTPLGADEIAGYECRAVGRDGSGMARAEGGATLSAIVAVPGPDTYQVSARALNNAGQWSEWSAPVALTAVSADPEKEALRAQLAALQAQYAVLQKQVVKNGLDLFACRLAAKK